MKKSIRIRARELARFSAPALSVLSLAVTASVKAQGLEINPVVVSATRMEQPLSQVLSSVSVITRQDIDKAQATTLADLLQGETGFEFGRNGGPGTVTSFFLRGQNSTNVALMIDGVRVQADSIGSLTQTDLPLSQIERIEILRGGAGALYGDAAIGGAINVYTRKGKGQMAPYGSVSYGTYNTRDLSVGYGGEVDGKSLDLNAGTTKSDGFSSMNKRQNTNTDPADNGYSKNNASLRFEDKLTQNLRLGVRVATSTSATSYDKNDLNAYSLKTTNDTYSVYARQQVNQVWFSTLDLAHAELKYEDLKNGSPYPANSFTSSYLNGKQNAIRWGNVYELSQAHKASFGIDVLKDDYDASGNNGYIINRNTNGYYGGLTSVFDDLTLQANVRRDQIDIDYTAYGSLSNARIGATSTLLGAGYQLNSAWRLTGTASTGFRAPTAYDISTNALVKQEEFKSEEAGVVYSDVNTFARLVYFKTTTQSAIGYDINDAAVNIGETRVDGLEANLRTNWRGHSIKLSLVQQNPWSITDHEQLGRRAKHYGSADISRPFMGYEVGTRLYAAGERKDSHYNTHMLAGYSTWSFYASRKIDNEWTARVKLENAFDRQYQLAYGYNTPGRGIYANLQYQPK
jgi:vitamin B12 transporter